MSNFTDQIKDRFRTQKRSKTGRKKNLASLNLKRRQDHSSSENSARNYAVTSVSEPAVENSNPEPTTYQPTPNKSRSELKILKPSRNCDSISDSGNDES